MRTGPRGPAVIEFWLSPTGRPDEVVMCGQDGWLDLSDGIWIPSQSLATMSARCHRQSAIIVIGKSYGVPSAPILLRGGADGQLHSSCHRRGRSATFAIPTDCEARADHGVETVRPPG